MPRAGISDPRLEVENGSNCDPENQSDPEAYFLHGSPPQLTGRTPVGMVSAQGHDPKDGFPDPDEQNLDDPLYGQFR